MLSAKTLVAIEVEVRGQDLVVTSLGAGARDWFKHAPWDVGASTLVSDLVCAEERLRL